MMEALSILWPPFAQPEGMAAITTGIWGAAMAVGALLGLLIGNRTRRRLSKMLIAAVGLAAAVVVYAQFNAERVITFRGERGGEEASFLLPFMECSTSAQFAPGGVAREMAVPDDVRALTERRACRAGMMASTIGYLAMTAATLLLASLLVFAALGAMVSDPRLWVIIGRIGAIVRSQGSPS